MAEPLATPEELSAYLQRPVPVDIATNALRIASGKVRGYINRPALLSLTDSSTAPDDVRAVVLSVAGRIVTNPNDVRQETAGAQSITYAAETIGIQLTEWERHDLKKYRVRFRSVEVRDPAEVTP